MCRTGRRACRTGSTSTARNSSLCGPSCALSPAMRGPPRDARLYQLQARNYAALGKRLLQHQSQAEVYVLQGALPAAIEQLQLARGAGDGDFYQLSVVDARLKELRSQHAQEMKDAKR